MKPSAPYSESRAEMLRDPELASLYLEEALKEENLKIFLISLRNVAETLPGGMTALSKITHLNRESLYKSLSKDGNPSFSTISKVLNALGFRMSIVPLAGAGVEFEVVNEDDQDLATDNLQLGEAISMSH